MRRRGDMKRQLAEEAAYRRRCYTFWVAAARERGRKRAIGISFLTAAVTLVAARIGGWL